MKKVVESKNEIELIELSQVAEGSAPTGNTYVSHTHGGKLGGTMILVHVYDEIGHESYQWVELRSPCVSLRRVNGPTGPTINSLFSSRKSAIATMMQYGSDVYEVESDAELIEYIRLIKT